MVPGAEGHLGVDDDFVLGLGHVGVETAVDCYALADYDGTEIVLLPLGVPVAPLDKVVGDIQRAFDGEIGQGFLYGFFVVKLYGRVGCKSFAVSDKRLKADVCQLGGEQIGDVLGTGVGVDAYLDIVVHRIGGVSVWTDYC